MIRPLISIASSILLIFFLLLCTGITSATAKNESALTLETTSQKVLHKVMEDIHRCDKTERYEYDANTGQFNPPELGKIKGLKLVKLYPEIAIFKIDEKYKGLSAAYLGVVRLDHWSSVPLPSVAFHGNFRNVRQRIESLWNVNFENDPLGLGLITKESAVIEIEAESGTKNILSIAKTPIDVFPHVNLPHVGCYYFDFSK